MSERHVLQALQEAVTKANLTVQLPIKYVGLTNKTPEQTDENSAWLEVLFIPNNSTDSYWSRGTIHKGTLRLLLHIPMSGKSPYVYMDSLQEIANNFTKGTVLKDSENQVDVRVTEIPDISAIIEDPPNLLIPLTIKYWCYKI